MLRLPVAAALLALAACGGERVGTTADWSPLDACDGEAVWAHDSADDHAEVAVSAAESRDGAGCLVVRAHRGTRGKAVIRRELDLDAGGLSALAVDVPTAHGSSRRRWSWRPGPGASWAGIRAPPPAGPPPPAASTGRWC
jgi:hypothetical protein